MREVSQGYVGCNEGDPGAVRFDVAGAAMWMRPDGPPQPVTITGPGTLVNAQRGIVRADGKGEITVTYQSDVLDGMRSDDLVFITGAVDVARGYDPTLRRAGTSSGSGARKLTTGRQPPATTKS